MKKVLALLCVALFVVATVGCQSDRNSCNAGWRPFQRSQKVCYPVDVCAPVVDECFSCGTAPACSSCSAGTTVVETTPAPTL